MTREGVCQNHWCCHWPICEGWGTGNMGEGSPNMIEGRAPGCGFVELRPKNSDELLFLA